MREILDKFTDKFTTIMWHNVANGEATGGLENGAPSLETKKKRRKSLKTRDRHQQVNCLGAFVTHSIWNAKKLAADPKHRICRRCGEGHATLKSRSWESKVNDKIVADNVKARGL